MTTPQTWFLCASIIFLIGVIFWMVVVIRSQDVAERRHSGDEEDAQKD